MTDTSTPSTIIPNVNLGNFSTSQAIVDPTTGRPSSTFVTWINGVVNRVQSAVNALNSIVSDVASALNQAGIAVDTSESASAAAQKAAAAVASTSTELALLESYVSPLGIISAARIGHLLGDDATITIAGHTRVYGDGTSVSVSGGDITGKDLSAKYYVYYSDPTHIGGSVDFKATKDPLSAGQLRGQHYVGSITTPVSGATTGTSGSAITPPRVVL